MTLKVTSRFVRWGRLLFLTLFGCGHIPLRKRNFHKKILVFIGLMIISSTQSSFALQLNSDSSVATAGYFQLSWSGDAKIFQLQESANPDFKAFKLIYTGKDLARVISGKPDGDYYYRLVSVDSSSLQVSNTVKVAVKHHSLNHAFLFFLAGAIVFIAIVSLIFKGQRLENNNNI